MRLKNTLIWGMILLLLAVFVYYYEVKGGRERQKTAEAAKHIFTFEEPDINKLELQYADTHIQCIKADTGAWRLVKPVDSAGDSKAIQGVIATLKEAIIERKLDVSDQTPAAYGLDNPQLKLVIASKDKEYKLLLGNRNPMGNLMYAKREADSQLFLLNPGLLDSFKRDVFELRDKRVISVPEVEVTQIELDYPERKLILTNDVQAGWQISYPDKLKADPDEVSSLIRQINSLRVKEFIAEKTDKPAAFGLAKPTLSLTVTAGKDQLQRRLLIGRRDKEKQGIYARRGERPQIMLLDTKVTTKLTKEIFDLRERRILKFDTVWVNELELDYPERALQLKKEGGDWQLVKPEKAPAKGYMVESLIYGLAYLKATAFIEGKPKPDAVYGFDKPQVKATLKLLQGDQSSTLSLLVGASAGQDDKSVYVRRNDGRIFMVPKDIVEQLSKKPADLKRDIAKD